MEERDEADESEGGRLPLFYTSGNKQIEYLPFTEAKAIERVHCPICLDAHSAGSLDWRDVFAVVSTLLELTSLAPPLAPLNLRSPARSSVGALVSPQGDAEAQQNDAQTLTHGATWTQRLRSRG
jgi:hypothetical protein